MSRRLLIATRKLAGLSGKVLLIQHNLPALVAAGWDAHVLAEKAERELLVSLGAQLHPAPRAWWLRSARLRRFSRRAEQLALKVRADLVIGHGDTLQQDVLHLHLCPHRQHREITGEELQPGESPHADFTAEMLRARGFRRLIANSNLMREEVIRRYAVPDSKISVVYPGYEPARFKPGAEPPSGELRTQLRVSPDGLLVGLITSGDFRTRAADQFLQAVALLPPALRDRLTLLIVGKDSRTEQYRRLSAQLKLEARTHFLSPRRDVEHIYRALDLYVHPAYFETFGMGVLEALACAVPVLATRNTGVTELYPSALQEWRLLRPDAQEIAAKMQMLLESPETRRQLAAQARAAIQHLTWAENARRHLEIYEQVLADKRGSA
ncbi:MAG: glycosyltransferase family 4 protein [Nevskiales bacterium]